jgi:hypothetical protein
LAAAARERLVRDHPHTPWAELAGAPTAAVEGEELQPDVSQAP